MPFCPQCGSEFEDDVQVCSDCGVPLTPSPAGGKASDRDLVEVWRTQGEMESQLTRALLDANGIESMLSGESVRLTHGIFLNGLAEVRILVRPEDAERACEIIGSQGGMRLCPGCRHPAFEADSRCRYCGGELT